MNNEVLDFQGFTFRYMNRNGRKLPEKRSVVKVYPLAIARTYIELPTPLFRTDYSFLLLIKSGGGEQQVDNEIFYLKKNSILFIREGHLNAVNSIYPDTEGYFIYIDASILPLVFKDELTLNKLTFAPTHSVSSEKMQKLIDCCELILSNKGNTETVTQINTALLQALLLMATESWSHGSAKGSGMSRISLLFKKELYTHFKGHHEVAYYAKALNVSPNYLNRSVKHISGKSPKKHINEILVNHGKILLQDSALTITDVAYELNFSDPSHFTKLFKKITGLTPGSYRQSVWNDSYR